MGSVHRVILYGCRQVHHTLQLIGKLSIRKQSGMHNTIQYFLTFKFKVPIE